MTKVFIHAFCLDEAKAVHADGVPIEMWVGPFDGVGITWDFLRGFKDDDSTDHEFLRDEDGFWYPVTLAKSSPNGGSMQPDPRRGRFSDLAIEPLDQLPKDILLRPSAAEEIRHDDVEGLARHAAGLAFEARVQNPEESFLDDCEACVWESQTLRDVRPEQLQQEDTGALCDMHVGIRNSAVCSACLHTRGDIPENAVLPAGEDFDPEYDDDQRCTATVMGGNPPHPTECGCRMFEWPGFPLLEGLQF
jgi:hypothetical protein